MANIKGLFSKEIDLKFWKRDEENVYTGLLCFFLVSIPVVELISEILGRTYYYQESLVRFIGIALLLVSMIFLFTKKTHIFVISDLFLALSVLFSIISIIFSQDLEASLTGAYLHNAEDPLQVLAYFMIFFMATQVSRIENVKKIFVAILIVMSLQVIPGFLQHFDAWPYEDFLGREVPGSYGLTQHYNYFASLMVMFSALSTMVFILKKNKYKCLWFGIATFCFLVTMYSWCRLAWVGLITYLLFIVLFEIIQKKNNKESVISKKRFIIIICTFALICVYLIIFDDVIVSQVVETTKEISGEEGKVIANGRAYIWRVGLAALDGHWFTGIGFDNYVDAFYIREDLCVGWVGYKGHNEYIHMLVTQGIFSALNYIAFCMYIFFHGCKKVMNNEESTHRKITIYILLAMIIAYFAQACFNHSVTNIAPYKWLVMGLLVSRGGQKVLFRSKEGKMEN
ncbi:MAG: O-antigen ligase family protein [Lachnospiraceae bacterium]|nr:O-antigen ligase family protein [Lachnospiraceae bacterium]